VNYYSRQFHEMKDTMTSLKRTEAEFRKLFSLESKEKVLETVGAPDSGSLDMENLKQQIALTMKNIHEIREYLEVQRDIYISTPRGYPVEGEISSRFGRRISPRNGQPEFHSGLDLAADSGNPVHATASGIVSFSGWSGGSGNLVVLEHGHGFSTCYAHNKANAVQVGARVNRGDIIGYVGSTGRSTGPHVHYEIWKNGKPVDPYSYVKGRV
jgi:murein DD-endopeptidase MepM/ murein hydrolase activator NlpD